MKTWLITGASTGIGRGIAEAVLKKGDQAAITARDIHKIEDLKEKYGDRALCISLEVTNKEQRKKAVEMTASTFGKIDVLVNNAGRGHFGAVEDSTEEDIRLVFETNFFGPVGMIREVLPFMRKAGSGMIINISSMGVMLENGTGNAYYVSSKAALEMLSDVLRNEVEPLGIDVMMLKNEKYKGDALLQKFFTVDYLTKKIKPNEGEVPQYYVQGHHPAIIDPETFDLVQTEIERRSKMGPRYSAASIFSSKIVCRECGSFYGSKVWHSNDKYRKVVWRCNAKYKEHGRAGKKCSTPTLTEDEIKEAFVKAMNIYLGDRDEIIRNMEEVRKILGNTDELEKEKAAQAEEMNVAAELIRKEMDRNARVAQDQKEYDRKFAALEERYRKAEAACREADEAIHRQGARNRLLASMIRRMKELDGTVTEFDADLWGVFVERMTVMADGKKVIRFKDGMEIEV